MRVTDDRSNSGSRRPLCAIPLLVALLALAIPASAAAMQPVYIADYGNASIQKLNPKTGRVKTVVQGDPLVNPSGITIANSGKLLVSDDGANAVFRVDPATGNVAPVASGPFVFPFDLQQARNGTIYVTDANAGPDLSGAVFRVNPRTQQVRTVVEGPPLGNPWGLALDGPGKLFLADDTGVILRVNTGERKVRPLAEGGKLVNPTGLGFGPGGDLYTADYRGGETGAVDRIDPATGRVQRVRTGPPLDENFGVDFNSQGRMFLPESPDAGGKPSIVALSAQGNDPANYLSHKLAEPAGVAVGR
jgi:sugar lactone lactonase YvrE